MSGANVFIDPSQFPESVRRDLIESLRARAFNHKFHYDSHRQAAKWLALHEAVSPARRDASCRQIYDQAFTGAMAAANSKAIHLIGLGCGGGQKEARLLELLGGEKRDLAYTASDSSVPLVLTAREAARPFVPTEKCKAMVCDLGTVKDLAAAIGEPAPGAARVVTLFGIMPNFEPAPLLRQIHRSLQPGDWMLVSANLAPGPDYPAGVRAVLSQYDNELTRDWLMTLPHDLGFEPEDGTLDFSIETDSLGLRRITAHLALVRARELKVHGETFSFARGERMRVFFSYRHTVATMDSLLGAHGFTLHGRWVNDSGEEGVFLCRRRN